MAVINYGNIRLSDVKPEEVEIFYTYQPSYTQPSSGVATALPSSVLKPVLRDGGEVLGGLYGLTLPKEHFTQKGIYNVLIKPRAVRAVIIDCGGILGSGNLKGIVMDKVDFPGFYNSSLNGYMVEYTEVVEGTRRRVNNLSKIITSSNLCEPATDGRLNSRMVNYRLVSDGSLVFLTLSPGALSTINPAGSFIGKPGQEVIISNTFFTPLSIEIELTDYDVDTLGQAFYGNQTRSLQDGTYSIYGDNNEIIAQYNLYEIMDEQNRPLYEVREKRTTIDFTKDFDEIVSGVNNI